MGQGECSTGILVRGGKRGVASTVTIGQQNQREGGADEGRAGRVDAGADRHFHSLQSMNTRS
ncbi:MAG: hypothetical protein H7839_02320 [Magnetococcus sp. YQC-5]